MHSQPSTTCLSAFPSFMQDITNTNALIRENKENIHPTLFGKLSLGGINHSSNNNNNNDGCGVKDGCRNGICTIQPSQQSINTSLVGDCYTPVINRHRPPHTGLTPGNNPARQSRSGAPEPCANVTDLSFLAESDMRDSKNSSFFFTPDKQFNATALPTIMGAADAVTATTITNAISPTTIFTVNSNTNKVAAAAFPVDAAPTQPIKLFELFQECAPILQSSHSPNMSLESIVLPKGVLLESDEEDGGVVEAQAGRRPHAGEIFYGTHANPVVPIPSLPPSSQELQEHTLLLRQPKPQDVRSRHKPQFVAPAPLFFANPHPVAHSGMIPQDVPPPNYSSNEMQSSVTRMVSKTAPLIAVGGRRVPMDKLHILVRPSTPEYMSNTANDISFAATRTGTSAPLIPSTRPMPAAIKMISSSLPSTTVAPLASSVDPIKRYPLNRQYETIVLEFARGVQMRFKANTARCVPVVGRHYIASVRSSRSPYDNVAYEDAGVCVQVQRHHTYTPGAETAMYDEKMIFDGHIVREVVAPDATRMRELEGMRTVALAECCKHFRFLNLPFELVDVYYTFDHSICVVYYSIQPQGGTSGQPNVARLMRMLQFRLQSKVYLKTITSSE